MRKAYIALIAAALPGAAMAQSAIDAQQITQSDFKGTARFMSMGGAFTALGGDLSTLNQNPAGIGIYRSNEIGATLDIDLQSTSTSPSFAPEFPADNSQTKVYCNNFGYIGATNLSGAMRTFNWGVTYNRAASFDRIYRGYSAPTQTSLTNYIASFTAGTPESDLDFGDNFNPYQGNADWLSILSYTSYLINPVGPGSYAGLYGNGTQGDALYSVRETGGVDEYNISFGGNVENTVYWGFGIGITDLNYTRQTFYSEQMANANVVNFNTTDNAPYTTGDARFDLNSRKYVNGTGWNMKFGVILKPINELRIGLAVHTPTWYHLSQGYDGTVDYWYEPQLAQPDKYPYNGQEQTDPAYYNWHLSAPWRLMAGVAGVIGGQAIVSLDYQFDGYGSMKVSTPVYGGYDNNFEPNAYVNDDISNYFKASNTLRLGLEYRVTPQFSLRAGYNRQWTNVRAEAADGSIEILTSGTDPSYSMDKFTQYVCFGLGYKYQAWYIDAAYVYKNRESTYHAYTNFNGFTAPQCKVTDNNSQIVLSTGFRF